ncbi:MAG: hypothetical protein AB7Q01_13190 [Gammaproteobacteria bacterium]
MKSVKASWVMMLCAMFAVAVPAYAQQPTEEPIIKLLNDIADKPENHLAIAAYYRTLAGDALAESEKHKAMRNTYRHNHQAFKSGAATGQSLARHCDRLIKLQEETAAEYEELAKLHEAEASAK